MRAVGQRRVPAAIWLGDFPESGGTFDRVLCGAAFWQFQPMESWLSRIAGVLAPGGAFAWNAPAAYLGIAGDSAPEGGHREWTNVFARLANGRISSAPPTAPPPDAEAIGVLLARAGFQAERWSFAHRMTLAELADWYRIPVLTDALFPDLDVRQRDRNLAKALRGADASVWTWEKWVGWTAWKQ
jgi:hypothetical protein